MKTVTDIQTFAREHGRAKGLSLTSEDGFVVLNGIYRAMGMRMPWSELRIIDTAMSTTNKTDANGGSTMNWPTTPIFTDLRSLEVQDKEDASRYKRIVPAEHELRWEEAAFKPATSVPEMFVKYRDNASDLNKIEFRPAFKYTGMTIRRTGIITPDELDSADLATVFENPLADDALGYMVAAAYFDIDGFTQEADRNLGKAGRILGTLFGRDMPPDEMGAMIGR